MDYELVQKLRERFIIEQKKKDRSGIYAVTQRELAYNSNKIEGSTLTKEQTASLFDTGILPKSDDYYKAKDIEEMNGHFLMFNTMLETMQEPLTQELIKRFHYEFKAGVFEDRANGYAVGEYKKRANIIGIYETVAPSEVPEKMEELLKWYEAQAVTLEVLAEFHARYESIHPFQDGNGRTGRMILFRECLVHGIVPIIIEDDNRMEYIDGLSDYRKNGSIDSLKTLLEKGQQKYREKMQIFLS